MIGLNSLSNTSGLACMTASLQSEADRPRAGWAANAAGPTGAGKVDSSADDLAGVSRARDLDAADLAAGADRESLRAAGLAEAESGVFRKTIVRRIFAIAARVRFYP